jgi:uncharacterized protein YoxC
MICGAMHPWLQVVIAVCIAALTIALVLAILALRRVVQRAEQVMGVVEDELRPTLSRVQALVDELRELSHDVRGEIERIGALTRRASELSDGLARLAGGLAGLTRVGQLVGIAAGLKTGVDVFLRRMRRGGAEGDNHG